jgi:hypothetical protein
MRTHVNRAFAELERRTERVVAVVRLLALLVLAVVFRSLDVLDSGQATMVPLGGFALITLAGLVTAKPVPSLDTLAVGQPGCNVVDPLPGDARHGNRPTLASRPRYAGGVADLRVSCRSGRAVSLRSANLFIR